MVSSSAVPAPRLCPVGGEREGGQSATLVFPGASRIGTF